VYNSRRRRLAVLTLSLPADPKEKVNHETFAQGVTAVGRSGRHICVCRCPERSSSVGADAVVSSQASAVRRVVARFTELLKQDDVTFALRKAIFRAGLRGQPLFFTSRLYLPVLSDSAFAPAARGFPSPHSLVSPPGDSASSALLLKYCTMIEMRRFDGSNASFKLRRR
jgi:hypothetical protein